MTSKSGVRYFLGALNSNPNSGPTPLLSHCWAELFERDFSPNLGPEPMFSKSGNQTH